MIPFIDNIGYSGPQPNFGRDNMTWSEMAAVTESTLDKGHVVFCTTTEDNKKGHYIFLGMVEDTENPGAQIPSWSKLVDKDGKVDSEALEIESISDAFIDALEDDRPTNS